MVKYSIYNYTESAVEKTTCISFPWTESAASSSSMASHAAASLGYLGLSSQFSVVSIGLTSACVVGAVRGYRWAPGERRVLAGFWEHDDHHRQPAGRGVWWFTGHATARLHQRAPQDRPTLSLTSFATRRAGQTCKLPIGQNAGQEAKCTQGELTSRNLWWRYDRHLVGITWLNVWS